jgi:hypothetical protein
LLHQCLGQFGRRQSPTVETAANSQTNRFINIVYAVSYVAFGLARPLHLFGNLRAQWRFAHALPDA